MFKNVLIACVEICVDADRQTDRQTDRPRYRVQDGSWPNHKNWEHPYYENMAPVVVTSNIDCHDKLVIASVS